MSDRQVDLVQRVLENNSRAELIIATDRDEKGHEYAEKIREIAPAEMKVERDAPEQKDWNDQLKHEVKTHREVNQPSRDEGYSFGR
jgi:hypothetical protein